MPDAWRSLTRLGVAICAFALILAAPVCAAVDQSSIDQQLKAATGSYFAGHVQDALTQLSTQLQQIDPAQNAEAFWRTGSLLVEFLQDVESYTLADQVLARLLSANVVQGQPGHLQWMQYYLGRNLIYLGKTDDGLRYLHALVGGDNRFTYAPAQRAAAILLSKVELDRGHIDQSANWIHRAVVGDQLSPQTITAERLDVLAEYASHLRYTRQLPAALALFARLAPLFDAHVPVRSAKYLRFEAEYLNTLSEAGLFEPATRALALLKSNAAAVDIVSPRIREQIYLQDLYALARTARPNEHNQIVDRLKELTNSNPQLLNQPRYRAIFSFFALLGGDAELADKILETTSGEPNETKQLLAYKTLLQSVVEARRGEFSKSILLAKQGLRELSLFLADYEALSANRLPTLTIEERTVLSLSLAANAGRTLTEDETDTLFRISQFLNRDKAKLGISERIARQTVPLDIQREDLRTRDRLLDIRQKLIGDAVNDLIDRVRNPKPVDPSAKIDFRPLMRLDEIEDKVSRAEQQILESIPDFQERAADVPIDLASAQKILRPDEALVIQTAHIRGIEQICVTSSNIKLFSRIILPDESPQLNVDQKLVMAAVRAEYPPSPQLDTSYPAESAYRIFRVLFGGIEDCLLSKKHILLATDPDLFAIPFNALLTSPPSKPFRNREGAWLPKSWSLSLLPSVRSLYQLRVNRPESSARQKFLGVGNPDFIGTPEPAVQLTSASLFNTRGGADVAAIANLPRLPQSAEELKAVARALGAKDGDLLLGADASERSLRMHALNDYRVLSFATHALVAGDIDGLSEPALVLTPGKEADPANDGLLTATEIGDLTLDANVVILSACNTAAADGEASGRGLSGLADAFFFAGARSLAVTQWAVFSDVAQKLGAGLIAHSGHGVGVAEGLRRTMTDYIATAQDDYLANPRFWAAFVIAGDGAVEPLAGKTDVEQNRAIGIVHEQISSAPQDGEFNSIVKVPEADTFFVDGIKMPSAKGGYAGSYLFQVRSSGASERLSEQSSISAGSLVATQRGVFLLGAVYSPSTKSDAVFRRVDSQGRELWRFVEGGPVFEMPVSVVTAPRGFVLVTLTQDFSGSASPAPPVLTLTLVSEQGNLIERQHYQVSDGPLGGSGAVAALDPKGTLVVALTKQVPRSPTSPGVVINPVTGSRRFCTLSYATELLAINPDSLQILRRRTIGNHLAKRLKVSDGHLYAAFSTQEECRLENGIDISEIDDALEARPFFTYRGVNDVLIWDFIVLRNRFILTGAIRTQLPTAVLREVVPMSDLVKRSADVLDPAFWEHGEEHNNGLILVIDSAGRILADRVFPDLRSRVIEGIAATDSEQLIAVGSAFGGHAWQVVLHLSDRLSAAGSSPRNTLH